MDARGQGPSHKRTPGPPTPLPRFVSCDWLAPHGAMGAERGALSCMSCVQLHSRERKQREGSRKTQQSGAGAEQRPRQAPDLEDADMAARNVATVGDNKTRCRQATRRRQHTLTWSLASLSPLRAFPICQVPFSTKTGALGAAGAKLSWSGAFKLAHRAAQCVRRGAGEEGQCATQTTNKVVCELSHASRGPVVIGSRNSEPSLDVIGPIQEAERSVL